MAADDPENDRLTYSLSGAAAAAFTIVATTGQIRTSEALDFETKASYSVIVEVHDGWDGSGNTSTTIDDTQAVTITVENVEEPGVVTLTTVTGTVQARVPVTAALERRRRPHRRHLAVVPLAQRPDRLGQHRERHVHHVHADAGGGPGNYIRATAIVHRWPRAQQDR